MMPIMFKQLKNQKNSNELLEKLAECLGNLARAGGTIVATVVEKDIEDVINWIQDKSSNDSKRYSGTLILREFCKKMQILTFNKLFDSSKLYKVLFPLLKDKMIHIRQTTVECIDECIGLISLRKDALNIGFLEDIFKEVCKAFAESDANFQHAALGVLGSLMKHKCSEVTQKQGRQIIEHVLKLNEATRSALVKRTCISAFPLLLKHVQPHFSTPVLEKATRSILNFIQKRDRQEKGVGFHALGRLVHQVALVQNKAFQDAFAAFLDEILFLVRQEVRLARQGAKNEPPVQEVLVCVRSLLKAHERLVDRKFRIVSFINDLFYFEFNQQLIDTLSDLSLANQCKFQKFTQIKLLNVISTLLTLKPSHFPIGTQALKSKQPDPNESQSPSKKNKGEESKGDLTMRDSMLSQANEDTDMKIDHTEINANHSRETYKDLIDKASSERFLKIASESSPEQQTKLQTLSLKTLASFDLNQFSDSITYFIENSVLDYLDAENPQVRKEAVKTCCSLSFTSAGAPQNKLGSVMERTVTKLLNKFFVTATTDSDYRIRSTMLKYLNSQFDPFIAKYENLLMLFNCLQDQNFEIRERTIKILGRLMQHNPSQVQPKLRLQLMTLIQQLEFAYGYKEREEAAQLLKTFVRASRDLCRENAENIMECLIKKIKLENSSSPFILASLEAIGELSNVNAEVVKPHLDLLIPLVLECVKDQSSTNKRETSLKTFIALIENTGFVVSPYFYYPELIEQIKNLIQNETQAQIRKLVLRLIGSIGAVDPYLVKQIHLFYHHDGREEELAENVPILHEIDRINQQKSAARDTQVQMPKVFPKPSEPAIQKEYQYPTIAIKQLIKVLMDPTLRDHHNIVLSGIKYIVFNLGQDSVAFINIIVPPLLQLIKQNDPVLTESLFQCLNAIIQTIPQSIEKFEEQLFETLHDALEMQSSLVLEVVHQLNLRCKKQTLRQMYLFLPTLIKFLHSCNSQERKQLTLQSIRDFDLSILDEHLHLLVPILVKLISSMDCEIEAIATIKVIKNCRSFKEYTSSIIHLLFTTLDTSVNQAEMCAETLKLFVSLANTLQLDFAPFFPQIKKALSRNRVQTELIDQALEDVAMKNVLTVYLQNLEKHERQANTKKQEEEKQQVILGKKSLEEAQELRKKHLDFDLLLREFDTSQCSIQADWEEWLKKTSQQLLKQSPSPILYACSTIAEVYSPILSELYNIAFVSCWKIMTDKAKEKIMESYRSAIESRSKPTIILQTILNLAEFMELDENTDLKLFSSATLAKIAEQCNAYAKALYYWELEFDNDPKGTTELLINTNYGLNQPEAAEGILIYAQKNLKIGEKEEWLENLHMWREALRLYEDKEAQNPNDPEILVGKLNCFMHLSDWENLSYLVEQKWGELTGRQSEFTKLSSKPQPELDQSQELKQVSSLAAHSAWNLGDWECFERYNKYIEVSDKPFEKFFNDAVIQIHSAQFQEAQRNIDRAREALDPMVTSLFGESYIRAYKHIQDLQNLRELEEMIDFQTSTDEARKNHLHSLWCRRFEFLPQDDLKAVQQSLTMRQLVIAKTEEVEQYLKLAKLAQDAGNTDLCARVLQNLRVSLKTNEKRNIEDIVKVEFALLQSVFDQGHCVSAISQVQRLLSEKKDLVSPKIKSQIYQKLAKWLYDTQETNKNYLDPDDFKQILDAAEKATQFDESSLEAWHLYSLYHYEASIYYGKKLSQSMDPDIIEDETLQSTLKATHNKDEYIQHIIAAMKGLVQQLALGGNTMNSTRTLQNTLRLLKLWFKRGWIQQIHQIFNSDFSKIDLQVWVTVIPQLIARIDIKSRPIREGTVHLLERISDTYPQSMLYAVNVMDRSSNPLRRDAAKRILSRIQEKNPTLVEQAKMVSNELIRSAIVLTEIWNEAIEEASRVCFETGNPCGPGGDPMGMVKLMIPYHKMMEKEPETLNEVAFYQGYAADLEEAFEWLQMFAKTKNHCFLSQAWDIYLMIFRKISPKLKDLNNGGYYELNNVAPKLMQARDLEVAMPGTYKCNRLVVKIAKFASTLPVLASKQHPRKMQVLGSNGKEYMYLLKGHEDIRQDQRVMQLFGLVNTLLATDPQTSKKDLAIRRYPIIPLSTNSGILGWVPNCDTLHQLIKEHRAQANIIANIEYKLMESMCEHFDTCPLPNKVEIFRYALDKTLGEDLQKVLWLKSQNSETWLERRTNYTRSLAVMSMVGYILGLGDRHPSNIMLDRYSGKIVHIDFGDCFELAMRREKFPEKVPFRLTRMLIKAMEVSGIEGNFKTTCENTMRVMRANKDSLLAILEAFVYDPLISFRLLKPNLLKQMKNNANAQYQNYSSGYAENAAGNAGSADRRMTSRQSIVEQVLERYLNKNKKEPETHRNNQVMAASRFSRRQEDREILNALGGNEDEATNQKELNETAEIVVQRINDKLRGLEYGEKMKTEEQVDRLIASATSHENLAQSYIGWCPFW